MEMDFQSHIVSADGVFQNGDPQCIEYTHLRALYLIQEYRLANIHVRNHALIPPHV